MIARGALLLTMLCSAGCAANGAPAPDRPVAGGRPSWVPPLTAAQRSLLAGDGKPVDSPVSRVFPDLKHFHYASDGELDDPRDAMRVTRMVAQVVENSPRQYEIAVVGAAVENLVVQYGPPGDEESNGWLVALRRTDGSIDLERAPVSPVARALHERGRQLLAAGKAGQAIGILREAVGNSPLVPQLQLTLAEALEASDPEGAEKAYRLLLDLDPTVATAHIGLARLMQKRNDLTGARAALAHALAYHPASPRAHKLAAALSLGDPSRVPPFTIFLDVDQRGAVRLAARGSSAARMYAGCRAVMRFEPELRGYLFSVPENEPYFLSLAEEILCYQSGIGAYLADRANANHQGVAAPRDDQAEALLGLAHREGLSGYLTFEVLGRFRPEYARRAPSSVHSATVSYVKRHLLGVDEEGEALQRFARLD